VPADCAAPGRDWTNNLKAEGRGDEGRGIIENGE